MSGDGAPTMSVDGTHLRVGLVHAAWHQQVMAGLVAGARRALDESGVAEVVEVAVPGSFELPVAAARLAASGLDAVVALGVVIRGGTPHFDYVCSATSHGLIELSVRTGIPVGFGLLTCDTLEQALDRSGGPGAREDKGHEAATAAVAAAAALRGLPLPAMAEFA
jgi:6,7-dimethyl-8-ribityllumazine synthase